MNENYNEKKVCGYMHCLFVPLLILLGFLFSPGVAISGNETKSYRHFDFNSGSELKVLWSLKSYHFGKTPKWTEEEAKKMLFKPLHIDKSSITFSGKSCTDISFHKETINSISYFSNKYGIKPDVISYGEDKVEVIKTDCHIEGFSDYMRLRNRKIVIYLQGIFFVFNPVIN